MLYQILISFYVFISLLLVAIILIQKGKGSMGLGNIGGSSQLLFGGSGGQDIFQKITWSLGALFIGLSILLFFMRSSQSTNFRYLPDHVMPTQPSTTEQPATPTNPSSVPAE